MLSSLVALSEGVLVMWRLLSVQEPKLAFEDVEKVSDMAANMYSM